MLQKKWCTKLTKEKAVLNSPELYMNYPAHRHLLATHLSFYLANLCALCTAQCASQDAVVDA
jgi:hypothetical protein